MSLVVNDNDFVIASANSILATADATEFRVHEYFSWFVNFWSEDESLRTVKASFNSRAKELEFFFFFSFFFDVTNTMACHTVA